MITMEQYWMGRDEKYPLALDTQTRRNAAVTVDLANRMLVIAKTYGYTRHENPNGYGEVSSGWRPPAVNAATPGASRTSKHMTGQAIDIYDPDNWLDRWCLSPLHGTLGLLGLWLEHPDSTPGWCHIQTVPPASGNRVFRP